MGFVSAHLRFFRPKRKILLTVRQANWLKPRRGDMFIELSSLAFICIFGGPAAKRARRASQPGRRKYKIELGVLGSINMSPLRGFNQVERRTTVPGKISEAHRVTPAATQTKIGSLG